MKRLKKAVISLLCISLFAALAMGSGSSDSSSSSVQKVGEASSTKDTSETDSKSDDKEKETEPTAKNEEIKSEYHVGDTFTKDGLSLTYVSSSYYESDNMFIEPAEGNQFIRLFFHVDNQSGSDKSVSTFEFSCYADGYECEATYNDDDLSASLSNGRSADGAVYFEIPEDAKEIEIEYEYDWLDSKKIKLIFEGDKDSGLVFEKNASASESAFHVGDIIETKKLRITYNKAAEYVSDNMFLVPNEGNKYIYIELEVENLSDSDQTISYFSFECYADGVACDGFYGLDDELSATLSAGRKAKGSIGFEVPKDAEVIEIEFEDNIWTDNKIIFLYEE
ncbi:MAG: DUF4352 domain-containing protein [Lachnospiraceae bacterium]|nr:DUF4352 domain-containing protein [Lachnospiraceae bacterium]